MLLTVVPANLSTFGLRNRHLPRMKASCRGQRGGVNLNQILENNFVRERSLLGRPVGDRIRKQGGVSEGS